MTKKGKNTRQETSEDKSARFEETMHDIFYNKAIQQRDDAWKEIEGLKATIEKLEKSLKEKDELINPWILTSERLPVIEQWYEITYFAPKKWYDPIIYRNPNAQIGELRTYCMYFYNGKFYDSEQDAKDDAETSQELHIPIERIIAWKMPIAPYNISMEDTSMEEKLLPGNKVKWYGAKYEDLFAYEPVISQDTEDYDAILFKFRGEGGLRPSIPLEYWVLTFKNGDKVLRPVLKKIRQEVLDNLNNVSYNTDVNDD